MYGLFTSRLAAAITRFTRVGAEAGAITFPSTSVASSGGGGGGSKLAPPVSGGEAAAGPASTSTSRHAAASATQRNEWLRRTVSGILFLPPTGLADGLALKELRASHSGRFAPVA